MAAMKLDHSRDLKSLVGPKERRNTTTVTKVEQTIMPQLNRTVISLPWNMGLRKSSADLGASSRATSLVLKAGAIANTLMGV